MKHQTYSFRAKAKIFPMPAGWVYVDLPKKFNTVGHKKSPYGFVQIKVRVGKTEWDTSILPKGEGQNFVALKKPVRIKEDIKIGDVVEVSFRLR